MAGVFIDIPGIGNVEAKNAATEATLKEILKAIKGAGGGGGGGGAGAGGGGAGAGGGGAAGGGGFFSKAAGAAGKTIGGVAKAAGVAAGGLGKMATGAGFVASKMAELAEKGIKTADTLSKLDGSASNAADLFSGIPILGSVFKMVAGAADKMAKAYQAATASGATFGGSISQFSAAATSAGMNLQEFGALIAKNGEAMGAFGVTTEDGSKRFAQVSKTLRTTSSDLYALGYSTEQINEGLANYGKILRSQGQQGTKSNAELAAGAKNYLKEMDMLAKVTGEERAQKEKDREALAKDGQFRAAMAGLGDQVESSVMTMIQSMPSKEMENFAKDIIANGTATTEENRKLLSQMPQLGAQFAALHAQTQKGVAVTKDQMNQAMNTGAAEAKQAQQRAKYAMAADSEWHSTSAALGSWNKVNKDAIKTASSQQDASKKATDGFNEKMEKMKQVLNGVSNTFTEILASSGFLDLMIGAVKIIAELAMTVLAPALKALDAVLQPVVQFLGKMLVPAMAALGAIFEKVALGLQMGLKPVIDKITETFSKISLTGDDFKDTLEVIDTILDATFGVFDASMRALTIAFDGAWEAVSGLLQPLQELWAAVSELWGTIDDTGSAMEDYMGVILEVGDVIGQTFKILGAIVGGVIDGMTWLVKGVTNLINESETLRNFFKTLGTAISEGWQLFRKYFSVEGFKAIFEGMSDGFQGMIDSIMHLIPNAMGGMSDEVYKQREEERKARAEARDTVVTAAKDERDKKVAEQKKAAVADKEEFSKKKVAVDTMKKLNEKELASREAAAKAAEKSIDYNAGPEELLKQFAGKEGSALVPKDQQATAKAEATKKEIESQADQKKAAEEKAKTETDAKKAAEEKAKEESDKRKGTQESAETLLAELNTKVGQLLKVNQEAKDIGERQLTATKGMSKNLYAA